MSYHTRNRKSSKQQLAYRIVSCPTCGAKSGDMCVVLHNLQATKFTHSARRDKYKHEIGGMNTPIVDLILGQPEVLVQGASQQETCSFPTKTKSEPPGPERATIPDAKDWF